MLSDGVSRSRSESQLNSGFLKAVTCMTAFKIDFKRVKIYDKSVRIKSNSMKKMKIRQGGFTAFSWFAGWLFSVGFLHLAFGKALLAIIVWPYYIGVFVAGLIK